MSRFEIKMPKLGESITEGTIVSWSVKVGDTIQEDDILFEVNTAKVSAEIPSPVAGKVVEILYKEGDTVAVGTVVAVVDPDGEESSEETTASENTGKEEANPSMNTISAVNGTKTSIESESQPTEPKDQPQELNPVVVTEERWYSPVVIQLAREANISKEELDTIQGTGYEGRLSKKDIKDYIDKKKRGVSNVKSASSASVSSATTTSVAAPKQTTSTTSNIPGVEVKEMDRVRRIIADHMVMSKKVSPHVTNVVEVDVTKLVRWRDKNKDAFFRREGVKLTYMPAITEAVAKALAAYPQVNVSVDGYNILFKKHINIGIAVSLNDGNLIVPVVHDADHLNLNGLAVAIDSLAIKARDNKLMPEDIDGGTFTITNFGTFRSLFGTPIINQPQVAILGVGYIEKKPAVVETPEGDTIAIRHKMYLSLSYDHRVVDGMLGGNFLHFIADYLENWKG
ncbi:dihydrolipoamide acetyltransferase family protein [Bacteroides bouchesdurhonensis]|uniref:dihydrolipoamide acetyltransferase family protein n=1 Tax=Bacteroides bouchesdurhonensis TaxID=1841855 RepID=UPI00097F6CCB|nr:dihydrolipoamide acetyltransferase family protein [Bacteroides bouchesdurhonensis]